MTSPSRDDLLDPVAAPVVDARGRVAVGAPPPPAGHPAATAAPATPAQSGTEAKPHVGATMRSVAPSEPDPHAAQHTATQASRHSADETDEATDPIGPTRLDSTARTSQTPRAAAPGRHASANVEMHRRSADGHSVLIIGGAEPLGSMIAERLLAAGHRLAVQDVQIQPETHGAPGASETVVLSGDRTDTEEIVHTVAGAELALGGLDAVVVLPGQHEAGTGIDGDASAWADGWSQALAGDVLAATCAAHTAARSFLTRRRAGRIIFVAAGGDQTGPASMHAAVTSTAIASFGAELSRELAPHGIGVSVVTASGHGGLAQFGIGQVADVVEALLATPILSAMTTSVS